MIEKVILCTDDEKTILDSLKSQLQRNFGYANANLYKHIEKPWNEDELIETIKTGLNL